MTARRPSTAWTFAITSIALFMVALDNLVVTTALPVIRADLGSSLADLEWMVNAYTLTFAVLLVTAASIPAASMSKVSGSTSTNTGMAPSMSAALAVAMKV